MTQAANSHVLEAVLKPKLGRGFTACSRVRMPRPQRAPMFGPRHSSQLKGDGGVERVQAAVDDGSWDAELGRDLKATAPVHRIALLD